MKFASVSTSIALSLILVLPLAISGCGTKSVTEPVETGITALASGGVAVYESYDAKGPVTKLDGDVSAMRVTRWQLRNMIAQATDHMGMSGAALDGFNRNPVPPSTPGFAAFLSAWLIRAQGPLSTYAASFMPKNTDYRQYAKVIFPTLVVTLFIADAARKPHTAARPVSDRGFAWEHLIAAPASAAGTCSTVTDFVSSVVADVTSALQVSGDGLFATLWNVVIAKVVDLAVGALKLALAPIIAIITTVASVLAMVTVIASSLQPWTVSVQGDPGTVTLLGTPVDGKFTATLTSGSVPWPDELKDCAKALAGVDLDQISAVDAPVAWETSGEIPDKAAVIDKQTKLGADKTAALSYRTLPLSDPQKEECSTLQSRGDLLATATIERVDVQRLEGALSKAALSQLPQVVQKFITPFLQPWIDSMMQSLANAVAAPVTGSGSVALMSYEKDTAKCTPAPTPAPSAGASQAPVSQATPEDHRIVGNWGCIISKHIVSSGVSVDVDVHIEFDFAANGIAVVKFPMSDTGTFGAGGVKVQADKEMQASPPGAYTYKAHRMDNDDMGWLHFPSSVSSSDQDVTFSNDNTYYATVTSPQNGEKMLMKCTRM